MKRNPHDFIAEMDDRAAELTEAAFQIVLSNSGIRWLDHKLHLWDAMKLVVYRWEQSERSNPVAAEWPIQDASTAAEFVASATSRSVSGGRSVTRNN